MFASIIDALKTILVSEKLFSQKDKIGQLKAEFVTLKNSATAEDEVSILLVRDLFNEIDQKLKVIQAEKQKQRDAVKAEKKQLINALQRITTEEENIGKAFNELKVIREKWTSINNKSPFEQKDVDKEFTKALEDFYYNINIFKAIQAHDLKRNQQLKLTILEKLQIATKQDASIELIAEVKKLQSDWEAIGPVNKDFQDQFWENYRTFLDAIYSKFKDFKESERAEHQDNLQKKLNIISYLNDIDLDNLKDQKDWKNKSKKVIAKQEEWKQIGFVPKGKKDEIWVAYRTVCDAFFKAKKDFFEAQKEVFKENKKLKTELCKKAEDLLALGAIKENAKTFVSFQNQWKKLGPIHQRDEQKLWFKFQTTCNAFFDGLKNAQNENNKEKDVVNEEKRALVEKLKSTQNINEIEALAILKEWWHTNRVHTKNSASFEKEFRALFKERVQATTLSNLEDQNYAVKIEIYSTFANAQSIFENEQMQLREQIQTINKDIIQYQNNLGFFGNSKGANALLKGVEENISKLEEKVKTQKGKLQLLKKVAK